MSFFEFLTKKTTEKPKKQKVKASEKQAAKQPADDAKKFGGYGKHAVEFHPRSFDDVASVIDCLIGGKPALVYLTEVRDNTSQRVLDILSGAIYALDGNVAEVGEEVYIFTPATRG